MVSTLSWLLDGWLDHDYLKIVSRLLLVLVAIGVVVLVRRSGLTWTQMGYGPFQTSEFVATIVVGLVSLSVPVLIFLGIEYRVPDDRVIWLSFGFVLALVGSSFTALLVGIFEETLFRGWMLQRLTTYWGGVSAAAVSSLLYALVHFTGVNDVQVPLEVQWHTLLVILPSLLLPVLDLASNWDSMLSLFAVGMVLCYVRTVWGLWQCIALHAAWVFGIRLFKDLTVRDELHPYLFLVGDYDRFNGLLVFCYLLVVMMCVWLWRRRQTLSA